MFGSKISQIIVKGGGKVLPVVLENGKILLDKMAQNPNGTIDKIDKGKQIYDKIQKGKKAGVAVRENYEQNIKNQEKLKNYDFSGLSGNENKNTTNAFGNLSKLKTDLYSNDIMQNKKFDLSDFHNKMNSFIAENKITEVADINEKNLNTNLAKEQNFVQKLEQNELKSKSVDDIRSV